MSYTLLLHIMGEDAVLGEVEELPDVTAQLLTLTSPRLRDGRDVPYFLAETHTAIYPLLRIHSIEVMPTEDDDQIVTFIRE